MKKFCILSLLFLFSACYDKGEVSQRLSGNEENLPAELKGLKVYTVGIGGGNNIKVAILDNQVIGSSYPKGKVVEHTVLIRREGNCVIQAESIISENDSIIVLKKAK